MQHFQVVSWECPSYIDESDIEQQAPLQWAEEDSSFSASGNDSNGHDSLNDAL